MSYIPELKVELVEAINAANDLSIRPDYISLNSPVIREDDVEIKVVATGGGYSGDTDVVYHRREAGKFFLNIPLFAAVDELGKTVTGGQVIGVINTYWPGLIDPAEIEDVDRAKTFTLREALSAPATFAFKPSSLTWTGTLTLSVTQRLINLKNIVDDGSVGLSRPPLYALRSYYADYTAYATMLMAAGTSGPLDSALVFLIGRGLPNVPVWSTDIIYNGPTDEATAYKVNHNFSHVMILQPRRTYDDVIYIHYNYDDITKGAVTTEDGTLLTDEQGRLLVVEQ